MYLLVITFIRCFRSCSNALRSSKILDIFRKSLHSFWRSQKGITKRIS